MKRHILIGALAATSLVASCAAEPEEGNPTPVVEEVTTTVEKPADPEVDTAVSGGEPDALDSVTPSPTTLAPSEAADEAPAVEPAVGAAEPPDPTLHVPEPEVPDLPEPGGPWVDPRRPNLTKTVPPPRR